MWETPKTNWTSGDTFDVTDYNRIKGNIDELKALSLKLWPDLPYEDYVDMGQDKTYDDKSFYADEINNLETDMRVVCKSTYDLPTSEARTYEPNTPFCTPTELNQLEGSILRLYDNLTNQYNSRRMLTFMFGKRGVML